MTSVEKVLNVLEERHITVSRMERDLGFSNGYKIDTIFKHKKAPQSQYRLWGVSFIGLIKLADFENILPIFA